MTKQKKAITAGELLEGLRGDPEYQARARQRDAEIERRQEEARIEQADLIRELSEVDIEVESVWDLVNTSDSYPGAIPILLKHLDRTYSERIREGIFRSLAVEEARSIAAPLIIRFFLEELDDDFRWIIGNTLSEVADENCLSQIYEILHDEQFGHSRSRLVHAVARLRGKEGVPFLIELLNDSDLRAETIIALGKLGGSRSKREISRYRDDPDDWIRECARKALRRIQ